MSNPANYFKKGQSGNPKGRPKSEWTIKGLIQEALNRADDKGKTDKEYVYEKLVDLAKSGDMMAQKEMNNRLEGMAKQTIDATVTLPKPLLSGIIDVPENNGSNKAE